MILHLDTGLNFKRPNTQLANKVASYSNHVFGVEVKGMDNFLMIEGALKFNLKLLMDHLESKGDSYQADASRRNLRYNKLTWHNLVN